MTDALQPETDPIELVDEPEAEPTVIIVATHNEHKIGEIARTLIPLLGSTVELRPTSGKAPKEDGKTFEENALIKARAAFAETGLPAIADDSGICVDALGGAPGIRSARYTSAGTDEANRNALVEALKGEKDRTAKFVCAVAFVTAEGERVEVGEWAGKIRAAAKGAGGFGYDPIFAPDGIPGTAAELTPTEKAALSHRARALGQIAPAINHFLDAQAR
ncbi:MAG: RdgB/HAM1 family non-canonical purine NTP pyrophosphatase [Microbacteriaceae bacterium]